jgi:hypothetical protein
MVSFAAVGIYALGLLRPGALRRSGPTPVRWVLLTFGAVALFGFGVATMNQSLTGAEQAGSFRTLVFIVGYLGLALVVLDGARDRHHVERLLGVVVAGAATMAVLGVVQFVTGVGPESYLKVPGLTLQDVAIDTSRSTFDRVQSTALHPIEYSVVLAVALPLALHLALHGTRGAPPARSRWVPVVAIVVGVPVAVSRSAVLGLAVAALLMAVSWSGRLRLNAAVGGLLLLIAMRAAFPGLLGTLRSMFTWVREDPSVEGRTEDYPVVLELVSESPLIGRGLGTFIPEVHFFLDNEYLGMLLGVGVVGVVALLALLLVAIGTGRGVYHHARHPASRSMGQALAAATAVSAVTWVTYDGLGFRLNAGLAFVLIGAVGALWRSDVGRLHWGRDVDSSIPVVPRAAEPATSRAVGGDRAGSEVGTRGAASRGILA